MVEYDSIFKSNIEEVCLDDLDLNKKEDIVEKNRKIMIDALEGLDKLDKLNYNDKKDIGLKLLMSLLLDEIETLNNVSLTLNRRDLYNVVNWVKNNQTFFLQEYNMTLELEDENIILKINKVY